jgi:hypothetical protein
MSAIARVSTGAPPNGADADVSCRQEANRKNAQKSTGPRTPEGKAHSRINAMKHGVLAEAVLTGLPVEKTMDFCELYLAMHVDLSPDGQLEETLVDRIISLTWRLTRASRVERDVLLLRAGGDPGELALGLAFMRDAERGDTLQKVSRYEGQLERSLYRTLHELQRIQGARKTGVLPPPVALDVTVDLQRG